MQSIVLKDMHAEIEPTSTLQPGDSRNRVGSTEVSTEHIPPTRLSSVQMDFLQLTLEKLKNLRAFP
jgi:hypothetical protein